MSPETQTPTALTVLTGHRECVAADDTLEQVLKRFAENGREFMAVVAAGRLLGVCAHREVAMKLGARYGFALYAQSPVREHLMSSVLALGVSTPLPEALTLVSGRATENFYDDVLLVDDDGAFSGFIYVHELVRLQTRLLIGNIADLEKSRAEVAEKNRAMEEDLLMAREVQMAMLPAEGMEASPGQRWRVTSHYAPAGGVSGDFFQVVRLSDACAAVLVCDVMGHGVRSALVTAMLRAFVEEVRPHAHDPGLVLTQLNEGMRAVLRQAGTLLFATAAYVVFDLEAGALLYGQAGHPTGFVRSAAGGVETLPCDDEVAGPALGLVEGHVYATGRRALKGGDTAILFTDGVFEARNASGEEWGVGRLCASIAAMGLVPAEKLLPALVAQAAAFSGNPFDDDVCLVSLEALA